MGKYVLLILLVLLVWWLLRPRWRHPPETKTRPNLPATEAMVHCAHCGLHLPQTEAIVWRGGYYCDETHRLAAERRRDTPAR